MLFEIISYSVLAALLFIIKELITTAVRNHSAHQFFKKRCPNLPVVPNPGIFGGHINEITWVKRGWRQLQKYHDKLGKTYGLYYCDTPVVSTVDIDLIKAMVIDRPNDNLNRFRPNTPLVELETDCIISCDEQQWRRLRGSIGSAFTKTKILLPNVQSEITSTIDKTIESIDMKLTEAKLERSEKMIKLNMDDMFLRYANALVFTCFYKQKDAIDLFSEKDYYTGLISDSCRTFLNPLFLFCVMFPKFRPFINALIGVFHPLGVLRRHIKAFIKQQTLNNLQARQQIDELKRNYKPNKTQESFDSDNFILKSGAKFRRNMIDYVTDEFHEGKLTEPEYLNNIFFLFLAAAKTSSEAIIKLLYLLAANPIEQEKLRAYVAAEGQDSEYLHWAIYEAMRLFAPTPFGCSRRLSYDIETKDGYKLPAGTLVFTPVHLIQRLPEYWGPDADEFKPERWRNASNFHPAQFLAFGLGKKRCPGQQFAVHEIKMLMVQMLSRYRFECPPETNSRTIMDFDTYLVFSHHDVPVHIYISRI